MNQQTFRIGFDLVDRVERRGPFAYRSFDQGMNGSSGSGFILSAFMRENCLLYQTQRSCNRGNTHDHFYVKSNHFYVSSFLFLQERYTENVMSYNSA